MSISRCRELKSNGGWSIDMVQGLALGERGLGSRDKWTFLYVAEDRLLVPGGLCSICSPIDIALMDQARHSPARFHSQSQDRPDGFGPPHSPADRACRPLRRLRIQVEVSSLQTRRCVSLPVDTTGAHLTQFCRSRHSSSSPSSSISRSLSMERS